MVEINLLSENNDFLGTCKVSMLKDGNLPKLIVINKKVLAGYDRLHFLQCPNSVNVYIQIVPAFADYTVKWKDKE